MYYNMDDYDFIRFERSRRKHKKYDAVLLNRKTDMHVRVPYGDVRFSQYKDTSGLGLYSHLDHNDRERRSRYHKRHDAFIRIGYYSPGYFSSKYLWG